MRLFRFRIPEPRHVPTALMPDLSHPSLDERAERLEEKAKAAKQYLGENWVLHPINAVTRRVK